MFTCTDAPLQKPRRTRDFNSVNRAILTRWHEAALLNWSIVLTGTEMHFMFGNKQRFHVQVSTSYSWLTVSECGRFPAWLEHERFKATLKINPLWLFYFFNCQTHFKAKRSKCVFQSSKASQRLLILKSDLEQMYSLKSVGGMSADTAAVSCTALFRILSRPSEHFHAVPEQ